MGAWGLRARSSESRLQITGSRIPGAGSELRARMLGCPDAQVIRRVAAAILLSLHPSALSLPSLLACYLAILLLLLVACPLFTHPSSSAPPPLLPSSPLPPPLSSLSLSPSLPPPSLPLPSRLSPSAISPRPRLWVVGRGSGGWGSGVGSGVWRLAPGRLAAGIGLNEIEPLSILATILQLQVRP